MPALNSSSETTNEVATPVTETTPAPAPAAKPTVPKTAKPKAKAKPAPAKKEKPKADKKEKATTGDRKVTSDLTPTQRHAKVLAAMRKLNAVNGSTAVTCEAVAAKSGLSKFEVYGSLWSQGPLQTGGYAKQCKVEGVRGTSYHLTAKGQKGDPE